MSYWRLHYHLIWATYGRLPLIDERREEVIRRALRTTATELRLILHAIGNVADHVHVVASVPPVCSLSQCLKRFKGASSRAVNAIESGGRRFQWQEGYGALSLGERSLRAVVAYVENQKQHHQQHSTIDVYERLEDQR